MKQQTFIRYLAGLTIVTLVLVVWRIRAVRPDESANPQPATTADATSGTLQSDSWAAPGTGSFKRQPWLSRPQRVAAPSPTEVRVYAAQALALVNQTPVHLRDLMPVGPDEREKMLTPEEYDSRLQRAIEMELTLQAARVQGVQLTPAQQQRLEQAAARHQADLEHYQQYGLSWSSMGPEQVAFEQRLLAAQMLEQNLVANQAGAAPSPDPEEQLRYEEARRDLLDQLQASANITGAVPAL